MEEYHREEIARSFETLEKAAGACFDCALQLQEEFSYSALPNEQRLLDKIEEITDLCNAAVVATKQLYVDEDFLKSLTYLERIDSATASIDEDALQRKKDLADIRAEISTIQQDEEGEQ